MIYDFHSGSSVTYKQNQHRFLTVYLMKPTKTRKKFVEAPTWNVRQHLPEILYIKTRYVSFTPRLSAFTFSSWRCSKSHMRKKARGKIVLFKTCLDRMWHTLQQRISAPDFRARRACGWLTTCTTSLSSPPPHFRLANSWLGTYLESGFKGKLVDQVDVPLIQQAEFCLKRKKNLKLKKNASIY